MRKLLAMVATLAMALTLSSPAFAKKGKKHAKTATTTSQTKTKGKKHWFHAKKKGATKGKKKGQ